MGCGRTANAAVAGARCPGEPGAGGWGEASSGTGVWAGPHQDAVRGGAHGRSPSEGRWRRRAGAPRVQIAAFGRAGNRRRSWPAPLHFRCDQRRCGSSCSRTNQAAREAWRLGCCGLRRTPTGVGLQPGGDLCRQRRLQAGVAAEMVLEPAHQLRPVGGGEAARRIEMRWQAPHSSTYATGGGVRVAPVGQRRGGGAAQQDRTHRCGAAHGVSAGGLRSQAVRSASPARCTRGRARRGSCAGTTCPLWRHH